MQFEMFLKHAGAVPLSRRNALRLGAAAGAVGAAAAVGAPSLHAAPSSSPDNSGGSSQPAVAGEFDDVMFDIDAVANGAWVPGPYGAGDQRGTFNEVTPQKTAEALRLLDALKPVTTYNLGETIYNDFPTFKLAPPFRTHEQRLTVWGYEPPGGFDGILFSTEPLGANRLSDHEERFPDGGFTFQAGTTIDNLNHIGLGDNFYNGFKGPEIAETWGTNKLGNEHMGPIVTRGILLDIVGLKVSQGAIADYFKAANGSPVLRDNYRVTVEDIEASIARGGLSRIMPGDSVLFRTGWTHLLKSDPERYITQEPGIYLREARYLGTQRPALVATDAWGMEITDPEVTGGLVFPGHQELLMHYGVRIGESFRMEDLADDGLFEFAFIITPQMVQGATAANSPPAALGQPGPRTYTVQAGDTLSSIAKRFSITVAELVQENEISDPDSISVGQKIRIPG